MTTHDVERALDDLDIALFTQRGSEVQGLCPMHEKRTGSIDHNPSWWINVDTGAHICFSCGYKGNLYTLVRDVKGLDHEEVVEYLKRRNEVSVDTLMKRLTDLPQYVAPVEEIDMSEARLAVFVDPPAYALESRSITKESAKYYGVLWDERKSNWILPLRDPHFYKLIGWQEKGYGNRFFRNYPAGVKKSKTLFGVDVQQESVSIVVESPLDCLRLYSAGFKGAVASCGALVSEEQIKLLRFSDKVIAAFDNPKLDKAGREASASMRQLAKRYGIELYFFNYGDSNKKDPGDMTNEEIEWGMTNARDSIYGEMAYL